MMPTVSTAGFAGTTFPQSLGTRAPVFAATAPASDVFTPRFGSQEPTAVQNVLNAMESFDTATLPDETAAQFEKVKTALRENHAYKRAIALVGETGADVAVAMQAALSQYNGASEGSGIGVFPSDFNLGSNPFDDSIGGILDVAFAGRLPRELLTKLVLMPEEKGLDNVLTLRLTPERLSEIRENPQYEAFFSRTVIID